MCCFGESFELVVWPVFFCDVECCSWFEGECVVASLGDVFFAFCYFS